MFFQNDGFVTPPPGPGFPRPHSYSWQTFIAYVLPYLIKNHNFSIAEIQVILELAIYDAENQMQRVGDFVSVPLSTLQDLRNQQDILAYLQNNYSSSFRWPNYEEDFLSSQDLNSWISETYEHHTNIHYGLQSALQNLRVNVSCEQMNRMDINDCPFGF